MKKVFLFSVALMALALVACDKDEDTPSSKLGENQIAINAKVQDIVAYYVGENESSKFAFSFHSKLDEAGEAHGEMIYGGMYFSKDMIGKTIDLKNPSMPQHGDLSINIENHHAGFNFSYNAFGNNVNVNLGQNQTTDTSLLKSGNLLTSHTKGKGYTIEASIELTDGTTIELKAFVKESDVVKRE